MQLTHALYQVEITELLLKYNPDLELVDADNQNAFDHSYGLKSTTSEDPSGSSSKLGSFIHRQHADSCRNLPENWQHK